MNILPNPKITFKIFKIGQVFGIAAIITPIPRRTPKCPILGALGVLLGIGGYNGSYAKKLPNLQNLERDFRIW